MRSEGRASVSASVRERAKQRHASQHPVVLAEVRGQADGDDVVGAVARGGEVAAPLASLVHRAGVTLLLWDFTARHRAQPDLSTHRQSLHVIISLQNYHCYGYGINAYSNNNYSI